MVALLHLSELPQAEYLSHSLSSNITTTMYFKKQTFLLLVALSSPATAFVAPGGSSIRSTFGVVSSRICSTPTELYSSEEATTEEAVAPVVEEVDVAPEEPAAPEESAAPAAERFTIYVSNVPFSE